MSARRTTPIVAYRVCGHFVSEVLGIEVVFWGVWAFFLKVKRLSGAVSGDCSRIVAVLVLENHQEHDVLLLRLS